MTPRDQALSDIAAIVDRLLASPAPVDLPPVVDPPPVVVPASGHPRIMLGTQGARLRAALAAGSPPALAWKASCGRWLAGGDVYNFAAWNGALYAALTGDARYGAKAIAQIDAQVTSAEVQIASGRAPEVAGDSYLQVGEMIGDLALVYDWCYPALTPAQRNRWLAYANQAVSNVWHHATATWGGKTMPWSGWATDNPCNNYYYSFLRATMLLGLAGKGEISSAADWLTLARDKIVGELVPVFERDLQGGGSREGTGYGVAMKGLWELYLLWEWSTGERLADKTSHTRQSLTTFMHQVVPTFDHLALTGDLARDSTAAFFDYHRDYLQKLIALYPTSSEAGSAVGLLAMSSVPRMANGFMQGADFVYAPATPIVNGVQLPTVRYAPGIGQIYARTDWSKQATWMNLIAGPYTESHAHQDQGSICLYKGVWLAPDAVFWSHSGVTQSGYIVGTPRAHSLVRVDGSDGVTIPQRSGSVSKVLALRRGPGYLFASLDLSPAYEGTAVSMVRRQVLWLQPDLFIIYDRVVSAPGTTPVWQLVVPAQPTISGTEAMVSSGGHTLRASRSAPATGTWTTRNLLGSTDHDFSAGFVLEQAQPGGDRTFVTVIAIDGANPPIGMPSFSDVGVSFGIGGKTVTVGAGIDPT